MIIKDPAPTPIIVEIVEIVIEAIMERIKKEKFKR